MAAFWAGQCLGQGRGPGPQRQRCCLRSLPCVAAHTSPAHTPPLHAWCPRAGATELRGVALPALPLLRLLLQAALRHEPQLPRLQLRSNGLPNAAHAPLIGAGIFPSYTSPLSPVHSPPALLLRGLQVPCRGLYALHYRTLFSSSSPKCCCAARLPPACTARAPLGCGATLATPLDVPRSSPHVHASAPNRPMVTTCQQQLDIRSPHKLAAAFHACGHLTAE